VPVLATAAARPRSRGTVRQNDSTPAAAPEARMASVGATVSGAMSILDAASSGTRHFPSVPHVLGPDACPRSPSTASTATAELTAIPAGLRRRAPEAGRDRIDRQEPRRPRHLGADRHQLGDRRGHRQAAFWVDGNIHSTEVAASAANLYFLHCSSPATGPMPK